MWLSDNRYGIQYGSIKDQDYDTALFESVSVILPLERAGKIRIPLIRSYTLCNQEQAMGIIDTFDSSQPIIMRSKEGLSRILLKQRSLHGYQRVRQVPHHPDQMKVGTNLI
jgi:hypothetical protein